MFYRFGRFICWLIFKIFFLLEVSGRENIPRNGAVMLVANHASFLDPPLVGVASRRGLVFFAHQGLFNISFLGKLLWSVNVKPINRQRLEFSILAKISRLVKTNKAFVFFPEGKRSKTGELQSGKPGVGLIAWKTRVKVVPAFIQGTYQAWPAKVKFFHPAKIKIIFGKPLELSNFYKEGPSKELFQKIADKMMRSINELGI